MKALIKVTGVVSGTWMYSCDQYDYDADAIEFHLNESSWCIGNVLDQRDGFTWDQSDAWSFLERLASAHNSCLCGELEFEFIRFVENEPV